MRAAASGVGVIRAEPPAVEVVGVLEQGAGPRAPPHAPSGTTPRSGAASPPRGRRRRAGGRDRWRRGRAAATFATSGSAGRQVPRPAGVGRRRRRGRRSRRARRPLPPGSGASGRRRRRPGPALADARPRPGRRAAPGLRLCTDRRAGTAGPGRGPARPASPPGSTRPGRRRRAGPGRSPHAARGHSPAGRIVLGEHLAGRHRRSSRSPRASRPPRRPPAARRPARPPPGPPRRPTAPDSVTGARRPTRPGRTGPTATAVACPSHAGSSDATSTWPGPPGQEPGQLPPACRIVEDQQPAASAPQGGEHSVRRLLGAVGRCRQTEGLAQLRQSVGDKRRVRRRDPPGDVVLVAPPVRELDHRGRRAQARHPGGRTQHRHPAVPHRGAHRRQQPVPGRGVLVAAGDVPRRAHRVRAPSGRRALRTAAHAGTAAHQHHQADGTGRPARSA